MIILFREDRALLVSKEDFNRLKKHAAGAVVTSPEIGMIGESGPELISPLRPRSRIGDLGVLQLDALKVVGDGNQLQLDQLTAIAGTLAQIAVTQGGGGFGGGGGGGGSNQADTDYGPGVKGDQPGGPTWDKKLLEQHRFMAGNYWKLTLRR